MANSSYQKSMARSAWRRWLNNDYKAVTLYEAYGRPSYAKERAWEYCERLCEKHDGYGLVVMSANTFRFSAGFEYIDKETGAVSFMYISPDYDCSVDSLTSPREAAANRRAMMEEAKQAA